MVAPLNLRQAARAIIFDDHERVLLVKFVFPTNTRWALPGGGIDPGEDAREALLRELREELGLHLDVHEIGPHVWDRTHVIPLSSGHDGQQDRIFVVRTAHFDPVPEIGWERMRAEHVHEVRWWTLDEIAGATEVCFAPARLADHLGDLIDAGAPDLPIDVGV